MLQMMEKKTVEEGENDQQLFDKYMCYCQTSEKTLATSISDAEQKIPQLETEIKDLNAESSQLSSDVEQAQKDKEAAEKSLAEAQAIRRGQAEAFAAESRDAKANIAASGKALESLRSGVAASFLQSFDAATLRHLANARDMPEWDKKTLTSFLMADQGDQDSDEPASGYESTTSDIIGVISQLKENMEHDLAKDTATEEKAKHEHALLVSAKTKESEALSRDIEVKSSRLGEVRVELMQLNMSFQDTQKMLKQDQKFLQDLERGCDEKKTQWQERSSTRVQELNAIRDTTAILNNDEAAQLFKRTFPTPVLLQIPQSSTELVHEARQILLTSAGKRSADPRLELVSMAMRGKKVSFEKVISLVDKMVELLGREQSEDDEKKQYCKQEIGVSEDEKKTLEESISDTSRSFANSKQMVTGLKEDIEKIAARVDAMNAAVAEATKLRKAQHTTFVDELATNNAAVQILTVAKERLKGFYHSDLLQTPTREVKASNGSASKGVVALQEAFSFLQTSSGDGTSKVAPPSPPETWGSSKAKGDSNAIFALFDTLTADIKKQVEEMQTEEKDAQMEYENFMADSAEKHAADAKAMSAKQSAKAETEAGLQKHGQDLKTTSAEATANAQYLESLHEKCDWLLANFKVRRDARTGEISSLRQAKGVLNGVDLPDSFLQLHSDQNVKHNSRRSLRAIAPR
jgi:outer membrane murein-binding lipoprotein Lpp